MVRGNLAVAALVLVSACSQQAGDMVMADSNKDPVGAQAKSPQANLFDTLKDEVRVLAGQYGRPEIYPYANNPGPKAVFSELSYADLTKPETLNTFTINTLLVTATQLASGHPNAPAAVKAAASTFGNQTPAEASVQFDQLSRSVMGLGETEPAPTASQLQKFIQSGGLRAPNQNVMN